MRNDSSEDRFNADFTRVLVVIPAHNEAASIKQVVDGIRRNTSCDILVVDDLSSDDTADIASAAGASVIRLHIHHGAWGAVQTGLRFAFRQGYQYVITMDADGQHDALFVERLLRPVKEGRANVCIGLCLERGSRFRLFAWHLLRRLSGLNIQDLTSGFRALDRSAMSALLSRKAAMLTYQDVGVLLLLRNNGLAISEVDVVMHRRKHGISRIFDSWLSVLRYVSQTCLLCVAKISLSFSRGNAKNSNSDNDDRTGLSNEL